MGGEVGEKVKPLVLVRAEGGGQAGGEWRRRERGEPGGAGAEIGGELGVARFEGGGFGGELEGVETVGGGLAGGEDLCGGEAEAGRSLCSIAVA